LHKKSNSVIHCPGGGDGVSREMHRMREFGQSPERLGMNRKLPVILLFYSIALSACAGFFGQAPDQGLSGGKPLTAFEKQRVECQTRLGRVEGISIEQSPEYIRITFRCDSLFDRNSERIMPPAHGLDELADILKAHPETEIKVDAHTDCILSEEDNMVLSEMRAASVKEALMAGGVDASRITARGWGESKPAASNATDAGRLANRRVCITLIRSPS